MGLTTPKTEERNRDVRRNKPQQLLKCIQVIFTGHKHTEDVPSDIGVHPLFPGQL